MYVFRASSYYQVRQGNIKHLVILTLFPLLILTRLSPSIETSDFLDNLPSLVYTSDLFIAVLCSGQEQSLL